MVLRVKYICNFKARKSVQSNLVLLQFSLLWPHFTPHLAADRLGTGYEIGIVVVPKKVDGSAPPTPYYIRADSRICILVHEESTEGPKK